MSRDIFDRVFSSGWTVLLFVLWQWLIDTYVSQCAGYVIMFTYSVGLFVHLVGDREPFLASIALGACVLHAYGARRTLGIGPRKRLPWL